MAKSSSPCSCERPNGGRTERRISTGASSRTGGSTAGGWCSVMCSTSARSIPPKLKLGAGRSKCSTRTKARPRSLSLFPEDRCEVPADDARRASAAQRDAALPAAPVGRLLARRRVVARAAARSLLGRAPAGKPQRARAGIDVLQVLATYRLIAPGSEWRLHRQWFLDSAMADLIGADFGLAEAHKLYACHDLLLAHKQALVLASDAALARSVQRLLRRAALRSDQHVFRGQRLRSARGLQTPPRLQPRQAARLPATRHRARRHARGPAARLRGPARQHRRQQDAARLSSPRSRANTARRGVFG